MNASLDTRPLWPAATRWLLVLGPGFFLVYGLCNAFSAHRPNVGSFFFEWERHIPFIPVMILPYMSIDLLFAGSFFLCRTRGELRVHAWRIALAILLSAVGFLLFPLKYGWARPPVGGWSSVLFGPLYAFDQPYNQCPSLHISLRALLWNVYGQHLRAWPWLRWCGAGWFQLITVSTLFTYQHHVIDLLGGFLVAFACQVMIREETKPCPTTSPSPPPRWRFWSKSSPAAACAGSAANPASDNACTSPTTPAT